MDISIITVSWNSKDRIGEQIRSVQDGCKDISYEEIVVDNGSTDGTVEFVKKEFPHVTVIVNTENNGFGFANNQGLAKATGEYILFLNPDMRVESGSLDTILEWMKQHPDVGIASVKLVDKEGTFSWEASPRRFPKVWEQLALILKLPHVFPNILHSYHMRDMNCNVQQDVDSVRGAFMLMRREFLNKTGWGFDPRYFFWYEDVDICREAQRHGFRVVYTPIISCIDYVGQSFKKRDTLWKQKIFTKSMLVYFQKWEPWWKWMWIAMFRPVGVGLAWVNENRKHSIVGIVALLSIIFIFPRSNLYFNIIGFGVIAAFFSFVGSIYTLNLKFKIVSKIVLVGSFLGLIISLYAGYQQRETTFKLIESSFERQVDGVGIYRYKLENDGSQLVKKFVLDVCYSKPIISVEINDEPTEGTSTLVHGNQTNSVCGKSFQDFKPRKVEVIVKSNSSVHLEFRPKK